MNHNKIFNDPIYGFITIPNNLIFELVEHPYFQRLRRIRQLGLTYLVYPGALHTRFQHALGAMHLGGEAIEVIRSKGHHIEEEEVEATKIAILLHDIGHGPFSHSLENTLVTGINHEDISGLFMNKLNLIFQNRLQLAIEIFTNNYSNKILHQLVSGQLDVDRLDYLNRDSFYTGVSEGIIGSERIIKMFNVFKDQLVVDAKGIYSIEKFLIARRLMYWQVYLHKTVISAEKLLINILKRVKELAERGFELFSAPSLKVFLYNKFTKHDFTSQNSFLDCFAELDDYDILASIKAWQGADDFILAHLCKNLINRNLYKIEIEKKPFDQDRVQDLKNKVCKKYNIGKEEVGYFVFTGSIFNNAYDSKSSKINILFKNGKLMDIAEASDQLNISALATSVEKYYLCYPKD